MNKLVITINRCYYQEKEYIISVIFGDFWELDYDILYEEKDNRYFKIESPDSGKSLYLPSILFATRKQEWLTKKSHPLSPLRNRLLEDLECEHFFSTDVPVLYGEEHAISVMDDAKEIKFDIDLFGSIFFLITLYEEINAPETDELDRFDYRQSILFKENLIKRPIANEYLEILWQLLLKINPRLLRKKRSYKLLVSHDIDSPLANNYSVMNFFKSCLADFFYRKSLTLLLKRIYSRVFSNKSVDPHNTFDYLMETSESLGVKSEFNFIVIDGKGGIDGAYDITDPFFKSVLSSIRDRGHTIGIHPSFYTLKNKEKTASEFQKLRNICTEKKLSQTSWGGRQHYLRWKNPDTWRIWNSMGATYDSSIGSAYFMGFRAGICYEYSVFDLLERKKLSLLEVPLIVMDVCAFKLGPFFSYEDEVVKLADVCKFFNGSFTLLFHNNYVISPGQKRDYKSLLEKIA